LKKNQPIGIFDSGIGGLTVAHAIKKLLPTENLIYFGDTAHLPYGDKSPEAIRSYSVKISDFLLEKNCKTIVIACNTASAHAYNAVKKHVSKKAEVFNVINPVADYVADKYQNGKIGVIGTKGTINSRIYVRKIEKANKKLKVSSLATPLLAPMIEEGFFNNYISRTIIHSYLSSRHLKNIQALILACTHYPLIKKEVKTYYQNKTEIIDSAEIVAGHIKKILDKNELLADAKSNAHYSFYVSDYTKAFEESSKYFFGKEIHLKKLNLWK
jgi:glutamate racemase